VNERTIREVGGEIAAEITIRLRDPQHPLAQMDGRHKETIIDVVMGVLARHAGAKIVNDEGLPVAPLPKKSFE
jgi:hypothetical protein